MQQMISKERIVLIFGICFAALIFIGLYSYRYINNYRIASELTNHTQQVVTEVQDLLINTVNMQAAQRGYVILGEEKYLLPYYSARDKIKENYLSLKNLVKDEPNQKKLIELINGKIARRNQFIQAVIENRKVNGFEVAKSIMKTEIGRNLSLEISQLATVFINEEKIAFNKRLKTAESNFKTAVISFTITIIISVVLMLITLLLFIELYNKKNESEKIATESELKIKKILNTLPVGIGIIDAKGNPYYSNDVCESIFGKNISTKTSYEKLPEAYQIYIAGTDILYPLEKRPTLRILQGEQFVQCDDLEILNNNKRIPLRVSCSPLTNSSGKIEYIISVVEDISNEKKTIQTLINAKNKTEEAIKVKENFLANMSHEIRTPMNAVIGFTNLLLKRDLPLQEKEYIRIIKNSGENLLRIINDILDISKIESGLITFEEIPISIKELFASLNSMLVQKANEKKLQLSFNWDKNIPDVLLGDSTRLSQILINLTSNAIKFTKKGSVTIFAKLINTENNVYKIEFIIQDTGIGIPKEKQQLIFERFVQAETDTTRNYGGTGLGLSIAKQLVEYQGGTICLESTEGVGSTFSFALPFKAPLDSLLSEADTINDLIIKKLKKINTLLVEDNTINIKLIESIFSEYNMPVDYAENGFAALEKIKNNTYDLILMDIEMPKMNGYETTAAIRNDLKINTPIIALTAHSLPGEKEKCINSGMNEYISKPIRTKLLFEKMILVFEESKSYNEHALIDLGFINESMFGKKEFIRDTLDLLLKQIPTDLGLINNAIAQEDFFSIKQFSHKMKSSASIAGIKKMSRVLEQMENLSGLRKGIEELRSYNMSLNQLVEQAIQEIKNERLNYT
jgi:signal transduction histidine kinase/CheY-like chemotaxis protein